MGKRFAWNALFLTLAVAVGVFLSLKPWEQYREQRQETDEAVSQMKDAERERADLIRERMRYESPAGREQLARERGYRRAGEQSLDQPSR